MKGSERQVLNIIKERKETDKESVAFKLGVSSEYIVQICSNLASDGYIEENLNGRFKLTLKGKKLTSPLKARKPLIRI